MKVGTDGCLLGAWASCPSFLAPASGELQLPTILDVGTGTGLIALMMAQRFPNARIMAIDIDSDAVRQARTNVEVSPFASRIEVMQTDFTLHLPPSTFHYSSIVSNPPYFTDSLASPDDRRTLARHATSLTYDMLMRQSFRLLAEGGEMSVIVPSEGLSRMQSAAAVAGFVPSRICAVYTTMRKPPRRYLLAFRKGTAVYGNATFGDGSLAQFEEHIVLGNRPPLTNTSLLIGSPEYNALLRDFYLHIEI